MALVRIHDAMPIMVRCGGGPSMVKMRGHRQLRVEAMLRKQDHYARGSGWGDEDGSERFAQEATNVRLDSNR